MKNTHIYKTLRNMVAVVIAVLGMMTFSTKAKAQSNDISAETRTDIGNLNKQFEINIQKKDFASIIDMYADGASIVLPGGKKVQGRKAIADYWYTLTSATSLKSEILVLGGSGKIVYQLGKWTITTVKDGVEKTIATDIVLVWKRQQDFSYKIQLNSSNNPLAVNSAKVEQYEAAKP